MRKERWAKNKEVLGEKNKQYYIENKENIAKVKREYNERNKEKIQKYKRESYLLNREIILLEREEYRRNNRDRINEGMKKYYQTNTEEIKNRIKEYRETPDGKVMASKCSHKRRERVGDSHIDLTPDQWTLCLEEVNYTCPMCGKTFGPDLRPHIDHIYPLSKGGDLTYWNVQPLCKSCNSSKYDSIRVDHQLRKAQSAALHLFSFLNLSKDLYTHN